MDWVEMLVRLRNWFLHQGRQQSQILKNVPVKADYSQHHSLFDYICIPDKFLLWGVVAFWIGFFRNLTDTADYIMATSPTPTSLLVGLSLKYVFGKPLVVEFRDPWISNPFRKARPYKILDKIELGLERMILQKSDFIITISEPMKSDICKLHTSLNPEHVKVVPNGLDEEEFQQIEPIKYDKFTILHAGNFYGKRTPYVFLRAIADLITEEPERFNPYSMQVIFAGRPQPDIDIYIKQLNLQNIVSQTGILPHKNMLAMMCGADVLLLIPGPGAGTMTGKIFEYIAAGKPILAIAEPGCAADLIMEHGLGLVSSPEATSSIKRNISTLAQSEFISFRPHERKRFIHLWSRRNLVKEILDFISPADHSNQSEGSLGGQ